MLQIDTIFTTLRFTHYLNIYNFFLNVGKLTICLDIIEELLRYAVNIYLVTC